jgi:3-oxoacyl-[acyl-carrier protein] reductase
MKAAGYGRILNVISTSVRIPLRNLGVSNTIRGAVASWAKSLSNEVAEYGITVNNLLPGFIQTSRLESLVASIATSRGTTREAVTEELRREVPAGRFGEVREIAALAAFLASPAAAYINGTSIPVDGGRTGSI